MPFSAQRAQFKLGDGKKNCEIVDFSALFFFFFRIVVVWLRIHRVRDRWVGPIAEREDREDRREVLRGAHRAGLHADRAVVPCEVRRAEDHAAEVPPYVPPFGC